MARKVWSFYEGNSTSSNTIPKQKYGYARVSTGKQKLRRQYDDIKKACPDAIIFSETYTGTKEDRPEWQKLLKLCRLGFVSEIWFCDVSRLSRNKISGFKTWKELYDLGIELHFIQTPQVDTTTYKEALGRIIKVKPVFNDEATNVLVESILSSINDYMVSLAKKQIYIAFDEAEQEARDLSQRTKEGMAVAKMNGKNIGRLPGVTIQTVKQQKALKTIKSHYKKYGGILNATKCIKLCGISKSTFYRYVQYIDRQLAGEDIKWTYQSKRKKRAQ